MPAADRSGRSLEEGAFEVSTLEMGPSEDPSG